MRSMKRIILSLSLLAAVFCSAAAQNSSQILDFFRAMKSETIDFTMSGIGLDGTKVTDQSGVMEVQYPDFKIKSSGYEVSCKGNTMWIYNPKTEEVVISSSMMDALLADCTMTVGDDGKPVFTFANKNGSKMVFKMVKMLPHDVWPANHFVLDVNSLGDDVVVTDLR